ncbi:hypothetical protein IMG5_006460 [Ichthyophthirius multifiliis]|uniref:Uncharacterized protein n=1 Tax=Ichthyophthirius multifiliis TaxID=5932 RepID=G0QJL9_ICHMU|nr:hypothetical protein IMG5_006460 [Ichthyophthirius multifiliis]EGR34585.1 hypothetical protein IMG5_006460 [Ichthyophthirius multifiliis]|eukprot:XP_004039889.1 hypothetical protein IMG5_006460 [Ichthyophthirius multifiliis]
MLKIQIEYSANQKRRLQIKKYKSQPEKYRLTSRIRNIDLTKPNLVFPLNIPLKFRYIYRPQKHPINVAFHDYINFKLLSGNEILLYLEQYKNLRPSELCSALIELSRREGSSDIDWNKHEWVNQTIQHVKQMLPQYSSSVVTYIIIAIQRLKIEDDELWNKIQTQVEKCYPKFNHKAFGYCFIAFLEKENRCTEEFKNKLQELLPIHLHQMTPNHVTQCFELCIQNNLLNEYLFEQHFHMLFWRRNVWFGPENIAKMLTIYPKLNFVDNINFFEDAIFANIPKIMNQLNENNTKMLIDAINGLQSKYPDLKDGKILKTLNSHLVFCQTKLKTIENAKFYNIVLNDFQKYREQYNPQQQQ